MSKKLAWLFGALGVGPGANPAKDCDVCGEPLDWCTCDECIECGAPMGECKHTEED